MNTYLWIGLAVQILIVIIRYARGVVPKPDYCNLAEWIWFILAFVLAAAFNIVLWPLTIICEISNTILGV